MVVHSLSLPYIAGGWLHSLSLPYMYKCDLTASLCLSEFFSGVKLNYSAKAASPVIVAMVSKEVLLEMFNTVSHSFLHIVIFLVCII